MKRPIHNGESIIETESSQPPARVGLFYDDEAYVVPRGRLRPESPEGPLGLMGRQVAGQTFLDALLKHGSFAELVALVRGRSSATTLETLWRAHSLYRPSPRLLRIHEERHFHEDFALDPPTRLLHLPFPLDPRFAWARRRIAPGAFAMSGVTHTLCGVQAVKLLRDLITEPFEPFDALVCTSTAVVKMVRAITDSCADYLKERLGGAPRLDVRLELIPLGVDPDRFRPATPDERLQQRGALGIDDDEIVVLFVGRLAHHAKAHPFPLYRALNLAARASNRKIRLLMMGWAPNQAIQDAFVDGAKAFAPDVRTTFLDGMDPIARFGVWRAADIAASLVDNIQETFGLVVVEALACGLPIVASDWDGYRDLIKHGETGFLIPTTMVERAAELAPTRLLLGEISYDHFLAESSQTVAVDVQAAAIAFTRLIHDESLRRSLGEAGRLDVLERFAWSQVVGAYESLWRSQNEQRMDLLERRSASKNPADSLDRAPCLYPELDQSFAGYPTAIVNEDTPLIASTTALAELDRFLSMPLTQHMAERRVADPNVLRDVLRACSAPCSICQIDAVFAGFGASLGRSRTTIGWMLKYDLLRRASPPVFDPKD